MGHVLSGVPHSTSVAAATTLATPNPPLHKHIEQQPTQKRNASCHIDRAPTPSMYHSQLGLQCYFILQPHPDAPAQSSNWSDYSVECCFEDTNFVQSFSHILDHTWNSDQIQIYRLSLASAINPSCLSLVFALSGLLCSKEHHEHCRSSNSMSPTVQIKVPPYARHNVELPIYDRLHTTKKPQQDTQVCCPRSLNLEVNWSLNGNSHPQQLIQWMLEEERHLFCVSMMVDIVYTITPHPDTVFTVIKL